VFGGRVVDVDVHPDDPTAFLVAYASGGLWKTTNNGHSFEPLFEQESVMTLGDVAADWRNGRIWVGTGEVNSSRSSYAGVGMFLSRDGGRTWAHKGLAESHHIGRVVLHPADTNTLWVAVLGHLYSPNPERGVYKTSDGGDTWRKVLYVNDTTGVVDLLTDPGDPDVLYAAAWTRTRSAWNFTESGPGSGIWRSEDGGESWTHLTDEGCGFPVGDGVGRIGLAAAARPEGPSVLYAVVDNQTLRPAAPEAAASKGLTREQLAGLSVRDFLALPDDQIDDFLKEMRFPRKYTASVLKARVRDGSFTPALIAEYLDNANDRLVQTEVVGAEVYLSRNGGRTWEKTHPDYLDDLYYTYGYYFGQIRAASGSPDQLYIFGVPVLTSRDAGRTWTSIDGDNVHGDHHALWVNPARRGHLILGNDGGVNISYDDGQHWVKCNAPPVGQFYYIAADMANPYRVYGGLQDNGVWMGPSDYRAGTYWHGSGQYPWKSILGGDGMQVAVDPRDNQTVYTGFQFGNYFRINTQTGERTPITPQRDIGEPPFRWNWQTPIHLSRHQPDILYIGSQRVHRSLNQGKDWQVISPDLTMGGRAGDVPFGTLTALHESPLQFGLLYAGSDDGLLHLSRDGGHSWSRVSDQLPAGKFWVSRVQASAHAEGRVYVALNGYRQDDFRALVYRSDDFGQHWVRIGTDLPLEPVNVIKEDPVHPDLIYIGTDHGVYVSFDQGAATMSLGTGLPAAPVHDLEVQPVAGDLLVGTHGRSIYLGDVSLLQQLSDSIRQAPLTLFPLEKLVWRDHWGSPRNAWSDAVREPSVRIPLFSPSGGQATWSVRYEGLVIHEQLLRLEKGLTYLAYNGVVKADAAKAYLASLNKKTKNGSDGTALGAVGGNGSEYLRKGSYEVLVEQADGIRRSATLVVE
jgi:photosystem II stability/assembly factor-like uncharacterized protein